MQTCQKALKCMQFVSDTSSARPWVGSRTWPARVGRLRTEATLGPQGSRASRERDTMGLRINNNIEAFNAHRTLSANSDKLSKSMSRLSSGFRINSAADDAAG